MTHTPHPESPSPRLIERRTLLKGAAWSVPIIAVAAAAPARAASVADAPTIEFAGTNETTDFDILHSTSTTTSALPVTVPATFVLTNGSTPHTGSVDSLDVAVGTPTGVAAPTDGTAYGFSVWKVDGAEYSAFANYTYASGSSGFPTTTWRLPYFPFDAAAGGAVTTTIEFILAGSSTAGPITETATFPVTITVTIDGVPYSAGSTITVPAGALLL